jgi:hypothetical protein
VKYCSNSYLVGNVILNVFVSIFILQVVVVVVVTIVVLYIPSYKLIDLFQSWLVIILGVFDDKQLYPMTCVCVCVCVSSGILYRDMLCCPLSHIASIYSYLAHVNPLV